MNTRKFSRVRFRVDAAVITPDRRFHGEVSDLSMNGVFVLTAERLPVGTPVDISILLSGVAPEISIRVNGTVSRTASDGIAFTFGKIDIDSYRHLKNIISYNTDDADKIIEEIHGAIDEKYSGHQ